MLIPGAAMSKLGKAGGTVSRVGNVLKSQPGMQIASGLTGGTVSEVTGSPTAGIAASLATPFAASGARRLLTPVRSALPREAQRLAKEAQKIGVKLTAGQKTGSRPLQTAESSLQQIPFTSGPQRKIYDQQTRAFNRAVLKHAGIKADDAAPDVIANGYKTLGAKFDDLVKKTTIYVDRKFVKDIDDVVVESTRKMGADDAKILTAWADDSKKLASALDDAANSKVLIEGDVYRKTATNLREAARTAKGDLKTNLLVLINKLDDAVERSMGKDMRLDWRDVRNKYRNLIIIDKAMSGGTQATRNAGDIPFGAFKSAVAGADKTGFARGRGDMNTLTRVGDFLADKIPNSGTPERRNMMRLLQGDGFGVREGAAAGGVGMALGMDPQSAAMLGVGIAGTKAATPRLVQFLMNSKPGQAYLSNTLASQPGPTKELLAKILSAQGLPYAVDSATGVQP